MRNRGATNLITVILILLNLVAAESFAQDSPVRVANEQYGYSVRIPAGWTQVPADVLGGFARSILAEETKVIFEAAFQPTELENWFQYPYVLIQVSPYDRLGIEGAPDMERIQRFVREISGFDVSKQEELTDEARETLSEASYHQAQFDDEKLRVTYDADLENPQLGMIRGRAVGQFSKTAFVQVVFYDLVADWSNREADRIEVLSSLAFTPDFTLTLGKSFLGIEWDESAIRGAVSGGVAGAVGAVVTILYLRRKRREAAS